ncbi:uncharacterized protein LOC130613452 [Hydractinia symbiolongicarpus]|uniref:uncharacterized protein LOC130613452 n=1 Tax=Hydractinia symbiolongicarpus TaxID=13093 RepID=UPI00254A12B9|nr:uncharacterized protein LOC130613452 [Hydractinia symbiolongicarpus]
MMDNVEEPWELIIFNTLQNLRTINICVLGFSGFLGYEKLAHLRLSDGIFNKTHLRDLSKKAKQIFIVTEFGCKIKEGDEYIFRAITSSRKNERLRPKHEPLSSPKFSPHSLRSGGATAAANRGVPDRLFKRHGRWRSEKAKDGYVQDDISILLSVSESLGL